MDSLANVVGVVLIQSIVILIFGLIFLRGKRK